MKMRKESQLQYKKVLSGEYTKAEAAEFLGLSIRHINRLIAKFNIEGEKGFIHKSRGRESKKKISFEVKEEIVNLYVTEYFDYNFTHFYEQIKDKYNISYKTLDNILSEANIISPEAQHKTVKLYNIEMKKSIKEKNATKNQEKIYNVRTEQEKQKHIRRSSLLYNFGQEIQMDAAFAIWYGKDAKALHLSVDKATKKVLYGYFDDQEKTRAYYVMLMNIILKYGIPKKNKNRQKGELK